MFDRYLVCKRESVDGNVRESVDGNFRESVDGNVRESVDGNVREDSSTRASESVAFALLCNDSQLLSDDSLLLSDCIVSLRAEGERA